MIWLENDLDHKKDDRGTLFVIVFTFFTLIGSSLEPVISVQGFEVAYMGFEVFYEKNGQGN